MISDFQVLGIEETKDLAVIKSAYRKKMKELHPDLAEEGESFHRHLLFIAVSAAYKRLIGVEPMEAAEAAEAAPRDRKRPRTEKTAESAGLAVHADPAYVFYRTGMKFFMMIHPSQWNETQRMLNTKIAGKDEDQELIRRKVMELVKLFPKAYYYFSIVLHEYPDSVWAFDAAVKTKLIEDRTKRYKHIIESFSSWNEDEKEKARQRARIRAMEDQLRKTIDADVEKKWRE
jgi:hypothetical protein